VRTRAATLARPGGALAQPCAHAIMPAAPHAASSVSARSAHARLRAFRGATR
jgi:hypothetical protein